MQFFFVFFWGVCITLNQCFISYYIICVDLLKHFWILNNLLFIVQYFLLLPCLVKPNRIIFESWDLTKTMNN